MLDHLNLEIWGSWWHHLTSAGAYRGDFTPKHTEKHLLGTLFYPILFWTKICSIVVLSMVIEKIQVSWVKPGRNVNQLAWNPTHLGKNCKNLHKLFDVIRHIFYSMVLEDVTTVLLKNLTSHTSDFNSLILQPKLHFNYAYLYQRFYKAYGSEHKPVKNYIYQIRHLTIYLHKKILNS